MTTQRHVLACIDGSAVTESVCDYATWYANKLDLPVGLLNAIDVPASTRRSLAGSIGMNSRQNLLEQLTRIDEQRSQVANDYSKALVEDAKSYINNKSDIEVNVFRRRGKLLSVIEFYKDNNRAIVMGRRGEDHQNDRINIGSQIETIARASSVPILICSEAFKTPSSYMIAFDASETAIRAVGLITQSTVLKSLQGHIVMIGNHDDSSKQSLVAAGEQLKSAGFLVDMHHLPESDAVDGLLAFQAQNTVDIIVIGAYGHSKFQQLFLGSTTTKVIAKTTSPVILVR